MNTEELRALRDRATKGPWVYDPEYPLNVYSDDATGSIIATVGGFRLAPRPLDEMTANASLIALAPDLLDEVLRLRADLAHEVEAHGETQAALRAFMADVDRLRADATEAALQYLSDIGQMTEKVTALMAERDALRDALGEISCGTVPTHRPQFVTWHDKYLALRSHARAALAAKP